jgi:alkanesulfonate monooxygenase SsuD/methylene tetrahydromethanopterin reductase-like flavin-dependent oxidoreductase (luciferase family)
VADSEQEAWDLYREPAEYFFNRCLHVYPGYADPPGYKTEATVRAGVEGMVERAAREAAARGGAGGGGSHNKLDFETMVEKGYIVLGTPDQVTEQLHDLCTSMNIGHLMALCHFGNMEKDLVKYNTELLANKVLPEISGLFEDDWDDHWWPKPLPQAERTVAESMTARRAAPVAGQ